MTETSLSVVVSIAEDVTYALLRDEVRLRRQGARL